MQRSMVLPEPPLVQVRSSPCVPPVYWNWQRLTRHQAVHVIAQHRGGAGSRVVVPNLHHPVGASEMPVVHHLPEGPLIPDIIVGVACQEPLPSQEATGPSWLVPEVITDEGKQEKLVHGPPDGPMAAAQSSPGSGWGGGASGQCPIGIAGSPAVIEPLNVVRRSVDHGIPALQAKAAIIVTTSQAVQRSCECRHRPKGISPGRRRYVDGAVRGSQVTVPGGVGGPMTKAASLAPFPSYRQSAVELPGSRASAFAQSGPPLGGGRKKKVQVP